MDSRQLEQQRCEVPYLQPLRKLAGRRDTECNPALQCGIEVWQSRRQAQRGCVHGSVLQ